MLHVPSCLGGVHGLKPAQACCCFQSSCFWLFIFDALCWAVYILVWLPQKGNTFLWIILGMGICPTHWPTQPIQLFIYSKGHPLVSSASRWVQLLSQHLWSLPRFCSEFHEDIACAHLLRAFFSCRALLISLFFQVEKYYMRFWGAFSYQLCFQLKK